MVDDEFGDFTRLCILVILKHNHKPIKGFLSSQGGFDGDVNVGSMIINNGEFDGDFVVIWWNLIMTFSWGIHDIYNQLLDEIGFLCPVLGEWVALIADFAQAMDDHLSF